MVNAVNSPHSTNQGSGHHAGAAPPEDLIRQFGEQKLLDRCDQCKEAIGDGRDGNTQDRGVEPVERRTWPGTWNDLETSVRHLAGQALSAGPGRGST